MTNFSPFRLGSCQVTPIDYSIQFESGDKVSLQPKFIEVLTYLAHQYPRVVPREELIEQVWAGNEYVGEKALTNAIWHLRQKLKALSNEDVIETIRKVGYRLAIAPELENDLQQENEQQAITKSKLSRYSFYLVLPFVIVVILLLSILLNRTSETVKSAIVTPITKLPGTELFAAPSPDGSKVVFKWSNGQSAKNLYLKDRNNPNLAPKQLTYGDAYVGHSVWSHDGQFLYFAKKDKPNNYCEIIQLKVATSQEKTIANCPVKGGYYYIDISPDDKTLAFHGYSEPADDSGIYFIDLTDNTSKPVRFSCSNNCGYKERDFKFSPDGKSIAVSRRFNRFNENIYLVDIATKASQQLTTGELDIVGMSWHPHKNQLVYAAQRADIRTGYILDLDTLETAKLPNVGFSYPAFATETAELFFQQRTEKYSLVNLPLASSIASMPFPVVQSEFSHQYPHYSPNADQIAYVSNESGYYELWLTDISGKNRKQVTHLQQSVSYPRWNHAGDKIAFLAPVSEERSDKIYIYDVTTQSLSIVKSQHKKHNRPTWTFDDKAIISAVYAHEFTDLYQIDIESGESSRLSFDGGRFGVMPSADTLVYTNEKYGLWRKKLNSELAPTQIISSNAFKTIYSWDLIDTGVYFRQKHNDQYVLAYYDYLLKDIAPIVRLPLSSMANSTPLNFIEEKQQLFFTASDSPQSNIKTMMHPLMENFHQ